MSRPPDGTTLFERGITCMVSPSGSTLQYFEALTQLFNYMDKSTGCNEYPGHMLCSLFNRALLLAKHNARSRPSLHQHNHSHFSGAAHARFDQETILPAGQSHRDRSHAATPDRHCCRLSSYDDALSDRMRRRRRRRRDRQPTISGTGRSHRVSRMASGSRPLNHCLFRPLRPAVTRSTRKLRIRTFHVLL